MDRSYYYYYYYFFLCSTMNEQFPSSLTRGSQLVARASSPFNKYSVLIVLILPIYKRVEIISNTTQRGLVIVMLPSKEHY